MMFTGRLNVLDTQSSFDHTFGLDLITIQIIKHSKRQYPNEEIDYLAWNFSFFAISTVGTYFKIIFNWNMLE